MNVATTLAMLWAASAPAAGGGISLLLSLLLIPLLYFMMIRPQHKRQRQWQQMLTNIKAGDRVTTTGGIRGTILAVKDDSFILRIAPDNLKIEVVKNAIASVTTPDEKSAS
jgi:preprotein translocase subunit YajC